MGTHSLPDIYTLGPRACGPWASGVYQANHSHNPCYGPRAEGVYVYQANHEYPCYNYIMYIQPYIHIHMYTYAHICTYVAY